MPAYICRITGTNILAGFYAAPTRRHLALLIDEERDPSDFECAVIPYGYGIEFRKAGATGLVNLVIGDPDASEELEAVDYVYLTEDLLSALTSEHKLRWTPILVGRHAQMGGAAGRRPTHPNATNTPRHHRHTSAPTATGNKKHPQ